MRGPQKMTEHNAAITIRKWRHVVDPVHTAGIFGTMRQMKITIGTIIAAAIVTTVVYSPAQAGSSAQAANDCADVLESWAIEPDSVSKARVDECKGIKGIIAAGDEVPVVIPFAGDADGQVQPMAADPCSGPNAGASVRCWGPWAALVPAAGQQIGPQVLMPVEEYDWRPELASQFGPDLASCPPGTPCGFATVVDGATTEAPSDQTTIAEYQLAFDGASFVVAPGTDDEIVSVADMLTDFVDRPDGLENMTALGVDGDHASFMSARVDRNSDDEIVSAADIWIDGDIVTDVAKSGYFAWGVATTRVDLDFLKTNNVSATFRGPMSVDNATTATVTANFGSQTTWSGNWTNPAYSFDAGGSFIGVDMISDPSRFSGNVGANSIVRGVLLGQRDAKSITHFIDVDLAGVGRIKDVGLLRE